MVPCDRKVTYALLIATLSPHKEEVNHVHVTISGKDINYPGVTATHYTILTMTKCLLNSTLSTTCSKFIVLEIKNFYYNTAMYCYEYMHIPLHSIPDEIIAQYNLHALASDGWFYLEIRKGMPGLKQNGIIVNNRLNFNLVKHGYAPVPRTPSLWSHAHLPLMFSLVIDDFGIKYTGSS